MARFTPIKVNFVALYFREWLPALMTMSTKERGIYCTTCFKIYEEGGRISSKTSFLATLNGLSEEEFVETFKSIGHKFKKKGNYIYHLRCTQELKRTEKLSEAGRKGAERRWKTGETSKVIHTPEKEGGLKGVNSPLLLLNETKTRTKEKEITNTSGHASSPASGNLAKTLETIKSNMTRNSDSFLNSFSPSCSSREGDRLQLYEALKVFFVIRNNADRASLDNVCKWAVNHEVASQNRLEFYKKIIALGNEAMQKARKNRWGYFFDVLKRELGYVSGK